MEEGCGDAWTCSYKMTQLKSAYLCSCYNQSHLLEQRAQRVNTYLANKIFTDTVFIAVLWRSSSSIYTTNTDMQTFMIGHSITYWAQTTDSSCFHPLTFLN